MAACGSMTLLCVSGLPARADEAGGEIPVCVATPANASQSRPVPNNVRLVTGAPYSAFGTSETVTIAFTP